MSFILENNKIDVPMYDDFEIKLPYPNIEYSKINVSIKEGYTNFINKSDFINEESWIDKDRTFGIKGIRNHIRGNTKNNGNHWVEIKALDSNGNNIQKNKNVYVNNGTYTYKLTDENTSSYPYVTGLNDYSYIQLDFDRPMDIRQIKIWHYYSDQRIYYNNVTDVTFDGVNWFTVYNSQVNGNIIESSEGQTININYDNLSQFKMKNNGTFIFDSYENQYRANGSICKELNIPIKIDPFKKWVLSYTLKSNNKLNKHSIGTETVNGKTQFPWWALHNKNVNNVNIYETSKNNEIENNFKTDISETFNVYKWENNQEFVKLNIALNQSYDESGVTYLKNVAFYNVLNDDDYNIDFNFSSYSQIKTGLSNNVFTLTYSDYALKPSTSYSYKIEYLNQSDEIIYTDYIQFRTESGSYFSNLKPENNNKNVSLNSSVISFTPKYEIPNVTYDVYLGQSENNLLKIYETSNTLINIYPDIYLLKPNTRYYYKIIAKQNGIEQVQSEVNTFDTEELFLTILNPVNENLDETTYPKIIWDFNYYATDVKYTIYFGKNENEMRILQSNLSNLYEFDLLQNHQLLFMDYLTDYYIKIEQNVPILNLRYYSDTIHFKTTKNRNMQIQSPVEEINPSETKYVGEFIYSKDKKILSVFNGPSKNKTEINKKTIVQDTIFPDNPIDKQIYIDITVSPQRKYLYDQTTQSWNEYDKSYNNIGNLLNLSTNDKRSLVIQINEIYKNLTKEIIDFKQTQDEKSEKIILTWKNPLNSLLRRIIIFSSNQNIENYTFEECSNLCLLIYDKFDGINTFSTFYDDIRSSYGEKVYYKIFQDFYTDETKNLNIIYENAKTISILTKDIKNTYNVNDLIAVGYNNKVILSWKNPNNDDWNGTLVVRDSSSYPKTIPLYINKWSEQFLYNSLFKYNQYIVETTDTVNSEYSFNEKLYTPQNTTSILYQKQSLIQISDIQQNEVLNIHANISNINQDFQGIGFYDEINNKFILSMISNQSQYSGLFEYSNETLTKLYSMTEFDISGNHDIQMNCCYDKIEFYYDGTFKYSYDISSKISSIQMIYKSGTSSNIINSFDSSIYGINGNIVQDYKTKTSDFSQIIEDSNVSNGIQYYYTLFPYDYNMNYFYNSINRIQCIPNNIETLSQTNLQAQNLNNGSQVKISWTNALTDISKTFLKTEIYMSKKNLSNYTINECKNDIPDVRLLTETTDSVMGSYSEKIFDIKDYFLNNNDEIYIKQFTSYKYNGYIYYDSGIYISYTILDQNPPTSSTILLNDSFENEVKINISHSQSYDYKGCYIIRNENSEPFLNVETLSESEILLNSNNYVLSDLLSSNILIYSDKNVEVGKTYYYKQFQVDTSGNVNVSSLSINTTIISSPYYVSNFISDNAISEKNIQLTWNDPDEISFSNWNRTVIVRNASRIPSNINDGLIITTNFSRNLYSSSPLIDFSAQINQTYYYRQFCIDNNENIYQRQIRSTENFAYNTPPSNITNIDYLICPNEVLLKWTDSNDDDWQSDKIMKSDDANTLNPYEGTQVSINFTKNKYDTLTDYWLVDNSVELNDEIYYGIFPCDTLNTYNTNIENITNKIKIKDYYQDYITKYEINNTENLQMDISVPGDNEVYKIYIFTQTNKDISNNSFSDCLYDNDISIYSKNVIPFETVITLKSDVTFQDKYYQKIFIIYKDVNNVKYVDHGKQLLFEQSNTIQPGNLINFQNVNSQTQINLSWENPSDFDYSHCIIVKKEFSEPTNINDGIQLGPFDNTETSYQDTDIIENHKYYYKAYTYDVFNNISLINNPVVIAYAKNESLINYIINEGNEETNCPINIIIPDYVFSLTNQKFDDTGSNILIKDFYGNTLKYIIDDINNKKIVVLFNNIQKIKEGFYFEINNEDVSYNQSDIFLFYDNFSGTQLNNEKYDIANISPDIEYSVNNELLISNINSQETSMIYNNNSIQKYIPLIFDFENNPNVLIEDFKIINYKDLEYNMFSTGLCFVNTDTNKVLSSNAFYGIELSSNPTINQGNTNGNYWFITDRNYNPAVINVNNYQNVYQKTEKTSNRIYSFLLNGEYMYCDCSNTIPYKLCIQTGKFMQYNIPNIHYKFIRIRKVSLNKIYQYIQ